MEEDIISFMKGYQEYSGFSVIPMEVVQTRKGLRTVISAISESTPNHWVLVGFGNPLCTEYSSADSMVQDMEDPSVDFLYSFVESSKVDVRELSTLKGLVNDMYKSTVGNGLPQDCRISYGDYISSEKIMKAVDFILTRGWSIGDITPCLLSDIKAKSFILKEVDLSRFV